MKNSKDIRHLRVSGLVLIPFFLMLVLSPAAFADMSAQTYCRLTIKNMEQSISRLRESITLANETGDPVALAQQEQMKREAFEQAKEALFESYGTTPNGWALYMGKHGRAVNAYLDENPEVARQIEDLSARIRFLLEEYESMKR